MSFRLVHISDMHLSRSHPFFFHNWDVVVDAVNARKPDLVVLTGDLSANGPDRVDDLTFVGEELARLEAPVVLSIPGNHDVGETPPSEAGHQPVNELRRKAFLDHVGPDYWSRAQGDWRFLGVNSYLFGSDLAAEKEQEAFVDQFFQSAQDHPVGVFIHTPFFMNSADESENNTAVIRPHLRKAWFEKFRAHGKVALVGSGHLHQYKRMSHEGTAHVWAPATAMISTGSAAEKRGGLGRVGFLEFTFEGSDFEVEFVQPAELINYDTTNWADRPGGHAYYDLVAEPYRAPKPRKA